MARVGRKQGRVKEEVVGIGAEGASQPLGPELSVKADGKVLSNVSIESAEEEYKSVIRETMNLVVLNFIISKKMMKSPNVSSCFLLSCPSPPHQEG